MLLLRRAPRNPDGTPARRTEVDAAPAVLGDVGAGGHLAPARATRSPPRRPGAAPAGGRAPARCCGDPVEVGPLAVLAVGGVVTMWSEAPVLGNHWLLAALVDLALLLAVGVGVARRRWDDATDLAERFLPVARLCLLGFYFFASFAKLNSAFFDRSVSCATFYFRESTGVGRPRGAAARRRAGLEWAVIVGTAAIELSIPWLLLFRRTRHLGVVVGLAFHAVLAIDRTHQFFDFSSVLAALFVLFLPATFGVWVAERVGSVRARLLLRDERAPRLGAPRPRRAGGAGGPGGRVRRLDPAPGAAAWGGARGSCTRSLLLVRGRCGTSASGPRSRTGRRSGSATSVFLLLPLVVVANGLTPYLELKTGFGWNMYANLRTVDGETNHYLVPRTVPLTDVQADLVEILGSDDPASSSYRDNDLLARLAAAAGVPLRRIPTTRIDYRRGNARRSRSPTPSDDPELVRPLPLWQEKLQLFRAVDERSPERCRPTFGPAR